jgi:hypothetical protein
VQLSVVYGREIDGKITTFGTTGYTYRSTFLLYDRQTQSIWYPYQPGKMNALCSQRAGNTLPFLAKPEPMPLAKWQEKHADSLVLVPSE